MSADPLAVVNTIRAQGCAAQPKPSPPLARSDGLDEVARELAGGVSLPAAAERGGYAVASSTSLHIRGTREDRVLERALIERSCGAINDPRYTELGVFQQRDETWIVLASRAAPAPPPDIGDPVTVARRVLELINAARAERRTCGSDHYESAPPLTLVPALTQAALRHALDMAEQGRLSHVGSDASTSGERITRAGYAWRVSGENLAAGQRDADRLVAGWLDSPGHCATLMGPDFTETGIAFALAPGREPEIYWAQVFAAPR